MMSIATLTFVIGAFCGINDPKLTKGYKLDCMEYMVNCAIVKDGQTSKKLVDKCRENWVEISK